MRLGFISRELGSRWWMRCAYPPYGKSSEPLDCCCLECLSLVGRNQGIYNSIKFAF